MGAWESFALGHIRDEWNAHHVCSLRHTSGEPAQFPTSVKGVVARFGLFDLIAIKPTDILCVPVKSRDLPGPQERDPLVAFRTPANCRTLIHRWRDGQCTPDVLELP